MSEQRCAVFYDNKFIFSNAFILSDIFFSTRHTPYVKDRWNSSI